VPAQTDVRKTPSDLSAGACVSHEDSREPVPFQGVPPQ
jgi:hypothetical protein